MRIALLVDFGHYLCALLTGVLNNPLDVVHLKGDVLDSISMFHKMFAQFAVVRKEGGFEDKHDLKRIDMREFRAGSTLSCRIAWDVTCLLPVSRPR